MPFYQENRDQALRFGDIVFGFVQGIPIINDPFLNNQHQDYQIQLSLPSYSVVLSPCCSIGDSTLLLAPLEQLTKNLFKNPYLVDDFTRLNKKIPAQFRFPPDEWQNLSESRREIENKKGPSYILFDYFIYENSKFLPTYILSVRKQDYTIGHYQIDFKKVFRIKCSKVVSSKDSPIDQKILQLSVYSRQDLREKMSWFYYRTPDEDRLILSAEA